MTTQAIIANNIYVHSNGHQYKVLHLTKSDEEVADHEYVVFQGLHDGRVWTRPIENFRERFIRLNNQPT